MIHPRWLECRVLHLGNNLQSASECLQLLTFGEHQHQGSTMGLGPSYQELWLDSNCFMRRLGKTNVVKGQVPQPAPLQSLSFSKSLFQAPELGSCLTLSILYSDPYHLPHLRDSKSKDLGNTQARLLNIAIKIRELFYSCFQVLVIHAV